MQVQPESQPVAAKRQPGAQRASTWARPDPGLIWKAWLSKAECNGKGIRRWQLWIWWSRPRKRAARLRAFLAIAVAPIVRIRTIKSAVDSYGDGVASRHGVPRARQWLDLLRMCFLTGVEPVSYYKFELFRPERAAVASEYLEDAGIPLRVLALRIPDSPDRAIFKDKRAFERWCLEHDLPSVTILAECAEGQIAQRVSGPLPQQDLFSKPSNLQGGVGTQVWRHGTVAGRSIWTGTEGIAMREEDLLRRLARDSAEDGHPRLLQELLSNHPAIAAMGNGSLSSVRVMTIRPYGQSPEVLLAVLRLATGNTFADNFDLGGLAVPVALQSGQCGMAVRKRGEYPLTRMARHPDTGAEIEAAPLPFWEQTLQLALRAHNLLESQMPIIGWDIAILETGPVLIECNNVPCANLAQMASETPLGATRFAECLVLHLRQAFQVY